MRSFLIASLKLLKNEKIQNRNKNNRELFSFESRCVLGESSEHYSPALINLHFYFQTNNPYYCQSYHGMKKQDSIEHILTYPVIHSQGVVAFVRSHLSNKFLGSPCIRQNRSLNIFPSLESDAYSILGNGGAWCHWSVSMVLPCKESSLLSMYLSGNIGKYL